MLPCHIQMPVPTKKTWQLESHSQPGHHCLHTWDGEKGTGTEHGPQDLCACFMKHLCEVLFLSPFQYSLSEAQTI